MKLSFVEIAGFRGFRDKTRLDMPSGFAILSGRNGSGKSTVLDAIDFAVSGTINKFSVREARGGGLDEHIWWVGTGKAERYYVSVGFLGNNGDEFVVTRSRERGCNVQPEEIAARLYIPGASSRASIETLMQTTLIRDELIASLSLDLPEQARFAAVRAAIGGMVGPDYSHRTAEILSAANVAKSRQEERIKAVQSDLSRSLEELTETRSVASRSPDVSEALQVLASLKISLPDEITARIETLTQRKAEMGRELLSIEGARSLAKELLPQLAYFGSPEGTKEAERVETALKQAREEKERADSQLAIATRLDAAEKESDSYVAHLAALIEHGSALGLQNGHCPLCHAHQTTEQFDAALASARERLSTRGEKLAAAAATLIAAKSTAETAARRLIAFQNQYDNFIMRRQDVERKLSSVHETYTAANFNATADNPEQAEKLLFAEREKLVLLDRALAILEGSNTVDKVKALEVRVNELRERSEQEAARLAGVERAIEAARQIDVSARTVANEILTEQFDTVMPLLKELYRRLRPHADWIEIESDFGGKVRGSLNFIVGNGHNPQFLFSSGQRRAAGLAFLLAIHLSRPWCAWRSLLLDDPVQHIDDYRALNLVEVLTAVRRSGRQVLVAVEDPALADVLSRRLRSVNNEIGRIFELRSSKNGAAEVQQFQDIYPMPRLVLRSARAS